MDVTRRGRTSDSGSGEDDNMIWLLGRLPKRRPTDGRAGEQALGDDWDPAPVIDLSRRRLSNALPPLCFNAMDGTTGMPLALSDAEPCRTESAGRRSEFTGDKVLLVMPDEEMRNAAHALLSQRGYEVVVVSTPLQAVWNLEHPPGAIGAVVVAQLLQHTRGADLLAFLARRYPSLLRVLVAPSECPANDVDHSVDQLVSQGLSELGPIFPARS